jgi:hypothetical protein
VAVGKKSYVPKEMNVLQTQPIRHYKDPHIGGATMFHDLLQSVRKAKATC